VHAAVPDAKAVDAMILSTVKRKASSPLNGTDHEVCAFRIFCSCIYKLVYGCQVYWIADALMSLIYDCILIYLLIEVENTDAVFNDSVSILIFVKITFENNRFMT